MSVAVLVPGYRIGDIIFAAASVTGTAGRRGRAFPSRHRWARKRPIADGRLGLRVVDLLERSQRALDASLRVPGCARRNGNASRAMTGRALITGGAGFIGSHLVDQLDGRTACRYRPRRFLLRPMGKSRTCECQSHSDRRGIGPRPLRPSTGDRWLRSRLPSCRAMRTALARKADSKITK